MRQHSGSHLEACQLYGDNHGLHAYSPRTRVLAKDPNSSARRKTDATANAFDRNPAFQMAGSKNALWPRVTLFERKSKIGRELKRAAADHELAERK